VCEKIPTYGDGRPRRREDAADLLPRHRRALDHYRQCKAVGRFPEDEIVERNATIFAQATAWAERTRRADDRADFLEAIRSLTER
jgi:hypothetical protein